MGEPEKFNVYQFFADGTQEEFLSLPPEEAVRKFRSLTVSIGAQLGTTIRVIITDGGDYTNFEWKYGEGIVYPPAAQA